MHSCSSSQMGWSIYVYLGKPGIGKLWKVGCHSGPVSRRNESISTTGSKTYATGDERPQLRAASILPYTSLHLYKLLCHIFHTRFHCSYPPILLYYMLLSDNSFLQHAFLTVVPYSMPKVLIPTSVLAENTVP